MTHDVESQRGLDQVRQLAEVEMELGFRSSFNFIPEGSYKVSEDLRTWLLDNGFEVGVHDLHHDGHLYSSRARFREKAKRINHYLQEWGAVGFRAGFMLRQLDWLHDLDIAYDASTFDTDPFEPQPDGSQTIFPFIRSNGSSRYVELPYTLPQDSTLFLVLRETDTRIWKRKLDWVVQNEGLALLNLHPDYVQFDGAGRKGRSFPVAYYREFLEYVAERYHDRFWHPLPKQVAEHASSAVSVGVGTPKKPRRVCMISYSYYESDNRVLRYAETLAARGDTVDILALRRSEDLPTEERLSGVRIIRIQDRFDKSAKGQLGHLLPILRFMRECSRWLKDSHRSMPYDLLHIHNMPDFVVFAGRYAKKHGAKVILDIHDLLPDFYSSKFGRMASLFATSTLRRFERTSAQFADHVIIANDLWHDRYAKRTETEGRCTTFINNVDTSVFVANERPREDDKQIILFPGSLSWHQGVDIAIQAFKTVHEKLPDTEFHIYGDGITKRALKIQAQEAGLNGSVRFFEPRCLREIARIMADADLGIVPKRADSFGNEAYSTKIMEFMSVGVPVVISSTKVDRFYFDDQVVRFFNSGDPDSLANELIDLLSNPEKRKSQVERAFEYVRSNCWDQKKTEYLDLVDSLLQH